MTMSHKMTKSGLKMRGLTVVSALALVLSGLSVAVAADLSQSRKLTPGKSWCTYPHRQPAETAMQSKTALKARVVTVQEIEPNDELAQAQFISVSSTIGGEIDVTLTGSISEGADVDYYRIFLNKGDVVGLSVTTDRDLIEIPPEVGLFPTVAICELTGDPLIENERAPYLSGAYPSSSPFPVITNPLNPSLRFDSALSWIAPEAGGYLIRVESYMGSSRGDYELKVVDRRPALEAQTVGATQIFFLDFDGVKGLNAAHAFGEGLFSADLTPMRYFLPDWGLTAADESAVIDAVVMYFQDRLDNLRSASLNGDRDVDSIDGHMDFEVRNSRDHADPWGQPNVSRVIIGGTQSELGIGTVGISGGIDPGRFDQEQTTVVLLDVLSDPDPTNTWSINNIPRAGGFTIIDAIGRTVGFAAVHEVGHTLGLWHTDPNNEVPCAIDGGGRPSIDYYAGAGPDGVLGTGDDEPLEFVPDQYVPDEMWYYPAPHAVMNIATGVENTNVRAAFALATGKSATVPPIPPETDQPKVSISVMPNIGTAPLVVSFAGGGVDPAGGKFVVFNWNFGDQTTGTGAFVTHTFNRPGSYIVTLSGTTDQAVTAQASAEVMVLSSPNELPQATIVATPTAGEVPLMVLFQAQAEDPDGTVISYGWDFDDGQTGSGQSIDHVFTSAGVYVVTLTVTDNLGAVQRVTETITVEGQASTGGTTGFDGATSPIPALGNCGAGASSAMVATMAGMLGMALIRRKH
jgi:hypothetical protein